MSVWEVFEAQDISFTKELAQRLWREPQRDAELAAGSKYVSVHVTGGGSEARLEFQLVTGRK